jgi:hypothetical protein
MIAAVLIAGASASNATANKVGKRFIGGLLLDLNLSGLPVVADQTRRRSMHQQPLGDLTFRLHSIADPTGNATQLVI